MRIVLDAMGSDTCPEPELTAAVEAAHLFGDEIILVGPSDILQPRLQAMGASTGTVRLVDASETITMQDKGMALALKAKRRNSKTSMAIGIDLVKSGEADAFVTAGNTGGAMATAYFRLDTIPGVERPALTATFPVKDGFCIVLDIGANPDCKPEHLVQFAIMGSIFARKVRGIETPRVAILSNGEEGGKGNELVKNTYPLLQQSGLNFIGNVEGKELFSGEADVVVTDGFTGNILLKSTEAVAKLIMDILRQQLKSNLISAIGGSLARPSLVKIRAMLNPDEYGAAPLLGVNGVVFIGHGRSNAHALVSAIKAARAAVEANVLDSIRAAIQDSLQKNVTKEIE
ncbi:MAG TPA: phosphate acyltransferase PlsX [Anaerolineales bacterium]|nr:phosphate acyltransferase PlsX [Anaerolineales bacterium]